MKTIKRIFNFLLIFCLVTCTSHEVNIYAANEELVGKEQIKIYSEGFYDYDSAEEVYRLTNDARTSEGHSELVMDENLTEIAMHRAAEIALLYDHIRPLGVKWYSLLNGKYLNGAGENIAYGQSSADSVTTAWLNSEGHRANIMDTAFTSIGIGSFVHNGTRFWVQLFSTYTEKSYSDKSGITKEVCVEAHYQNVGEFTLDLYDNTLKVGEFTDSYMRVSNLSSSRLKFNVKANNVTFKSSDENVAIVDENGRITAVGSGSAQITAILDETLVATCDISVKDSIMGDVNDDGIVNASDALLALKHAAKISTLTFEEQNVAEMNDDGVIDSADALVILKIAARLM